MHDDRVILFKNSKKKIIIKYPTDEYNLIKHTRKYK